jgi:hypothetical protein
MYPGMAKTARDEGFTEIADWFETLGQGREGPRRQVHGDVEVDLLIPRASVPFEPFGRRPRVRAGRRARAASRPESRSARFATGPERIPRRRARPRRPRRLRALADLVHADRRADLRPDRREVLGAGHAAQGDRARLRSLPRLPHVLQVLRQLPGDVRPDRQEARRRRAQAHRGGGQPRRRRVLPVQAVRRAVPVHAARQARVPARLPQARPRHQAVRAKKHGVKLRDRCSAIPTMPAR